jgi:hypothetical protein
MDEYEIQIHDGKQIVTDYIQKERPDYLKRINAMKWDQDTEDWKKGLQCLVLLSGEKRYLLKFSGEELADTPGTPGGDRQLKKKVDEFFRTC